MALYSISYTYLKIDIAHLLRDWLLWRVGGRHLRRELLLHQRIIELQTLQQLLVQLGQLELFCVHFGKTSVNYST